MLFCGRPREFLRNISQIHTKDRLTEYAEGRFVWQKQSYDFVINTRTGEIYTSVHVNEIKERLEDVLAENL